MNNRLFLSLLLLSTFISASAAKIRGTVLSETDSTAVVGAICRLMDAETLLRATQTEENGGFSLETSTGKTLKLIVSMTGYKPTEVVLKTMGKDISLGDIYLSGDATLGEVTVSSRAIMDSKGRTIVFPTDSEVKASPTSISLFQKLPLAGLLANPVNRSLSVDGGTPMILINGVPSTITDVLALKPKEISRIEYSRLTPARYADRNVTGLISITLKKRDDGGSVYLYGRSAVNTAFVDASVSTSYHQGPSQFKINYVPSWRNYQSVYDFTKGAYIAPDFKVDLDESDRSPFDYFTNNISLKYIYSPQESTVFSAALNLDTSTNHRRVIQKTSDSQLGDYDSRGKSRGAEKTPALDLYFRRDFNEKNSLELQVVGTLGFDEYRRANEYFFADGSEQSYLNDIDSHRRSLISEVSYIHSFSDNSSLSGGYQNTLSHSSNTYLDSGHKAILTENNNYVYARFSQRIKRVFFALSTGAKLYWVKNDLNRRDFIRNISLVQASWNVSQSVNLQGAFSYSPNIPGLSALTDHPQQSTPYLVVNGNPSLKVAENFIYQLMASYSHKYFYVSATGTYMTTDNATFSDVTYLGDGQFLSQSVNSKRSQSVSGRLYFRLNEIKGFGASLSLGYSHYESAGKGWDHSLDSFSGSVYCWWTKDKFTLSYWRSFPGKSLRGHMVSKGENGDEISLVFRPNKHWAVEASWMYMFHRRGTEYPAWNYSPVNPSYRDRYIRDNGNMVTLSVTYDADFGSIFRTSRRNLNNTDNGSSILKN